MFTRLTRLTPVLALIALLVAVIAPTPAAAQEDDSDYAYLRIAHLSYDTGALEIYIDGQPSDLQAMTYEDISGWAEMEPGTYSIAFVPVRGTLEDAVLGPYNYTFEADDWTTLAVFGSTESETLALTPLRMDYSEIKQGEARVAVFHALSGAPAVDVMLDDGTMLAEELPFAGDVSGFDSGLATFAVASGSYTLQLVPHGETEPVLLTLEDTELDAGTFYFVSVSGTPDAPVPVVAAISIDEINDMTNAQIGDESMDDDMSDEDMNGDMNDDMNDDQGDDDQGDDDQGDDDQGDDDQGDDMGENMDDHMDSNGNG